MPVPSEDIAKYPPADGRGLSLIVDPELRRLAEYWASKRNCRPVPSRADIDPVDIPWALPHFFLIDYDRDTGTYRYRIAGGEVETIFQSATGSHSMRRVALRDMLKPEAAALVEKRWQPLADRGDVIYMTGMVYLHDRYGLPACGEGPQRRADPVAPVRPRRLPDNRPYRYDQMRVAAVQRQDTRVRS